MHDHGNGDGGLWFTNRKRNRGIRERSSQQRLMVSSVRVEDDRWWRSPAIAAAAVGETMTKASWRWRPGFISWVQWTRLTRAELLDTTRRRTAAVGRVATRTPRPGAELERARSRAEPCFRGFASQVKAENGMELRHVHPFRCVRTYGVAGNLFASERHVRRMNG